MGVEIEFSLGTNPEKELERTECCLPTRSYKNLDSVVCQHFHKLIFRLKGERVDYQD
jgi:hypothetical protein